MILSYNFNKKNSEDTVSSEEADDDNNKGVISGQNDSDKLSRLPIISSQHKDIDTENIFAYDVIH